MEDIFDNVATDVKFEKILHLKTSSKVKLGENVIHDAELIESFSDSKSILDDMHEFSIFKESHPYLKEILTRLVSTKLDLWQRQTFFENIKIDVVNEYLNRAKNSFESIKWILTDREEEVRKLLSSVLYRWPIFRRLNQSHVALDLKNIYSIYMSPVIGVTSPLIYFTLPFVIMRMKYKINISLKYYLQSMYALTTASFQQNESKSLKNLTAISYGSSILFYVQGVYNTISNAISSSKICSLLSQHVKGTCEFIKSANKLSEMFSTNPYYELNQVEGLNSSNMTLGIRLKGYEDLVNRKNEIYAAANHIFVADALLAIKKFIVTKGLRKARFDFTSKVPRYAFHDCWHVSLSKGNVVKNSLANSNAKRNCIITGPNASGKSTFIKAVLLNVLLSQSIAYCGAEIFALTPFNYIGSQICVPDCKGKESLFEAEMSRSKSNLEYVVENPKSKCILFLDEIFNSTNPLEGICGSHSIVKNIGKQHNAVVFLTTHYDYICDLNSNKYALYKFDCDIEGGSIKYDYEIKHGVNKQLVALDILKMSGFNTAIIDDAMKLKEHFIHRRFP